MLTPITTNGYQLCFQPNSM